MTRAAKLLRRLRAAPNADRVRMVGWPIYTAARSVVGRSPRFTVNDADMNRWFGEEAPQLYHCDFGRLATGPPFPAASEATGTVASDPRLRWELARDQDLAALLSEGAANGWTDHHRDRLSARLDRVVASAPPNPMEAALRCITWLEVSRFAARQALFSPGQLRELSFWILECGAYIERRLHEVPLGGNHYLSHAVGLLYIGRLLPGLPDTDRWAARGQRIVFAQVLRQFHPDGGGFEQSSAYHLFSLDLVLGAVLLIRSQGSAIPRDVTTRIRAASIYLAALLRADGSIPIIGDDDSGRMHRWGGEPAGRELCALAALVLDDPDIAPVAAQTGVGAAWLLGPQAPDRLKELAAVAQQPRGPASFPRTGLHVLRSQAWHATLWARDPAAPAMLAHAHADQNSVDIWCGGEHVVRDPGSGLYLGDAALRNRLRSTEAHSTLSIDGVEVSPFHPDDLFFMPPLTRGRRLAMHGDETTQHVTATHDGFRRLHGRPAHFRTMFLDLTTDVLRISDEVRALAPDLAVRRVDAWWHWGREPGDIRKEVETTRAVYRFTVGTVDVEMRLPFEAEFVLQEPFPWSPRYGVIRSGWRSNVKYQGRLPFEMTVVFNKRR